MHIATYIDEDGVEQLGLFEKKSAFEKDELNLTGTSFDVGANGETLELRAIDLYKEVGKDNYFAEFDCTDAIVPFVPKSDNSVRFGSFVHWSPIERDAHA